MSWLARLRNGTPLRERNPVAVALVGLVIIGVVAYLAFNANNLPLIGGGTGYTAYFTESAGLTPGNEVRVAGVRVGRVTGVSLDGNRVKVSFQVKNAWVGNASTVAIDIKTILGSKYLALDPLGAATQDPAAPILESRTTSPYDVTQAFNQLGQVFGQLDTNRMAKSLETISQAFADTPPAVHESLTGLAALSRAVASQDAQLAALLQGTRKVTGTIASEDSEFQSLINHGNQLLAELRLQQQSIASLLIGTQQMAIQLRQLVSRDNAELGPALSKLGQVTAVLQRNQDNLRRTFALLGPYSRLVGNTVGNGRWFDSYLCHLVTRNYGGTQPKSGCMPPKVGG
ncbi:MAG: MCE family protein [Nocardiopsaceae bacterium]|jgi:phospholipid/cholesterol/gamma-HCH transport system substrate-binding protein|nr:MCE family protein [Nocardiopsaceae bacterium]